MENSWEKREILWKSHKKSLAFKVTFQEKIYFFVYTKVILCIL